QRDLVAVARHRAGLVQLEVAYAERLVEDRAHDRAERRAADDVLAGRLEGRLALLDLVPDADDVDDVEAEGGGRLREHVVRDGRALDAALPGHVLVVVGGAVDVAQDELRLDAAVARYDARQELDLAVLREREAGRIGRERDDSRQIDVARARRSGSE